MGFIEAEERRQVEVEEFKRMVLQVVATCGGGKDEDEFRGLRAAPAGLMDDGGDGGEKVVCVTSGVSFLGLAIINRLLSRGYSVRIMVDNEGGITNHVTMWSHDMRQCGPNFHLSCIDVWLRKQSTCPVCRYPVQDETKYTRQARISVVQSADSPQTAGEHSRQWLLPGHERSGGNSSDQTHPHNTVSRTQELTPPATA